MEKKSINLFIACLMLFSVLAFASAAVSFDNSYYSLDKASNYFVFTVSSNESDPVATLYINDSRFILNDSSLDKNTTKQIKVTYDYENNFDLDVFNSASFTLSAKNSSEVLLSSAELIFPSTYCKFGPQGSRIRIVDLEDEELDNKDSWKWRPLDNIEISFTIQNKGSKDEDISGVVEYCLWDETNEECVIEGDFDFDVDGRDEEDYTIEFSVDPSKLDPNVKTYLFYLKAYDDSDYDEEEQCAQTSETVRVKINSNEVIIDEKEISFPFSLDAGETITIEVPVINIGSKEQKDISVKIYSTMFDLTSQIVQVGNLKSGKSKKVQFTFTLPKTLISAKNYEILFDVYDDDDNLYKYEDGNGNKVSATFSKIFKIDNGAADPSKNPNYAVSVSAELVGEAKAGENIQVTTKITNIGASTGTFSVNAIGYSDWADSVSLSQTILLLKAGESQEITMNFNSKKDIQGTKRFNVEVIANNELIASQAASLEIEGKSGWFNFTLGNNWYLWLIGGFNLLLILAIIFVIIRLFFK